jgi:hypothetical protein
MTTLSPALSPVKPTRARRPAPLALARALDAALRRLEALIPSFNLHPAGSAERGRWLDRTWWPTTKAADRAEDAVLAHLRRCEARGFVAEGRLYLNLTDLLSDLSEFRPSAILVVPLADVAGLATPPPAARDWPAWTDDGSWASDAPIDPLDAARALGRQDAEDGRRRDPGLETSAESLAYCLARDARLRELAELPIDADREWLAGQHADGEGLTADEESRFELAVSTVSALDHLLDQVAGDRPDVVTSVAVRLAARASCYRELGTPVGDQLAGELAAVVAELRAGKDGAA